MMDSQYFIDKFKATHKNEWCSNEFVNTVGQKCANGHCGVRLSVVPEGLVVFQSLQLTDESRALQKVFSVLSVTRIESKKDAYSALEWENDYSVKAALINNGHAVEYQQPTHKERILAALRDIQRIEKGQPTEEEERKLNRIAEGERLLNSVPLLKPILKTAVIASMLGLVMLL